jgi:hypothetical protein
MSAPATSTAAPDTAPETAAPTGRERNGRFAKGNPGGPGNPYARLIAEHRKAIAEFMTPERRTALLLATYESALRGDHGARKLLFGYMAGKAAPDVNPDRSDRDEWEQRKETAGMMQELPGLLQTPDPALPLAMVRGAQPLVTEAMSQQMGVMLAEPEQHEEALPDLEFADDDEDLPPADDTAGGPAPSPNGDNGRAATKMGATGARTGRPSPLANGDNGRAVSGMAAAGARSSAAAPSPNGGNGGSPGHAGDPRRRAGG